MTDKIDRIVMNLTTQETKELLRACLEQLAEEDAIVEIRQWIKDENLEGEFEGL